MYIYIYIYIYICVCVCVCVCVYIRGLLRNFCLSVRARAEKGM